ncbi:hypothetical protein [Erythrobacter crassostreae]|uniref:DUF2059 domain-containing protein n=1 Tax=Erythrobacter crassostreae TaxID=2828328 RepID=A0A9X1F4J7_9SPHN|nr:hypothetical protein [Erythrobacter crassostrea]MBV7260112.1 hypothetical protein [Erythrobacter crassostrea]
MMRWITTLSLAATAAFVPAQAAAQVTEMLACSDTGYTDAEQATIDRYIANFEIGDDSDTQPLGDALRRRITECAGEGASETTLVMLSQHQFALLSERGIAATRPDVVGVVTRIDTELSQQDNERFMALFEKLVFGGAGPGAGDNLNAEEAAWFEKTLIGEPVGATVEQSELIGGYLAAKLLRDRAVKALEAL